MELKAFKGMPHEFGGIDYTEGSEVEGGEFAVQIGKSGNEYIFDKNSSEGERLSKEYKRLDKNGRLTEDDPLALEAFDQMAREEALKHAQRSVNEKGIDPFRNMYDQGGQAANGGVKYAAGGVNKYATGGYNPITMGVDPFSNYIMDPLQMQNQPSPSEISGGYELFQDSGSSFINNLTGSTTNNSINLNPQDNLSYNTSQQSNGLTDSLQTDPMTPMPTMKSYQLPVEQLPEMPTADASYNVTSGINDSIGGSQGGSFGDAMGNIQKAFQIGGDLMQTLSPETKQGRDWQITEKGNTRQRSIAPKYAYSTGAEMLGAAMSGAGQGAQIGKMAGPYGAAIGAAAGMVISPMIKGLQDERAARQLDLAFKSELAKKNAEERLDEQIKAIGRDVDYRGKIDKDRYAGLNQLGTSSKEGGALPKNKKPIYGYYANGGGSGSIADQIENIREQREIETLSSGITYQDLQGGRSYPVYDDMGNEIQGRRNIGASSLSPGFDIIQENPKLSTEVEPQFNNKVRTGEMLAQSLARQSAPQYYAFAQDPCDPCGKNDLNEGFGLYDKPIKYAQKGYDYYSPSKTTMATPTGNYNNPDIRPTSTLINNETDKSYQFQDGGGKKKDEKSYDGMKDPVQWDIMQNYIGSNDTRNRMSQAAVGSGDEMYAPYRLDNTCVAGVNCFEDLAGIPSSEGIPDDIYNNRALRDFFESEEGKKYFRKLSGLESFFGGEKPGDYVQFENTLDLRGINRPSHIGLTTGKNIYLGDGSEDKSLYYNKIRKNPDVQIAGREFTNVNPYFYRMLDKENRQKILEAALQAQEQGKDVIRPAFGDEEPLYLPLQQYRKNTSYPIAGF